jgi:GcrA cell cycle regulator
MNDLDLVSLPGGETAVDAGPGSLPAPAADRFWAWPAERVAELQRLYAEGMPYRQMAVHFGLSKSAIIGKCFRLGLARREPIARLLEAPAPPPCKPLARAPDIRPRLVPEPVAVKPHRGKVLIWDLRDRICRWPLWHDREWSVAKQFFCGKNATDGLPYCDEHCRMAYSSARAAMTKPYAPRPFK